MPFLQFSQIMRSIDLLTDISDLQQNTDCSDQFLESQEAVYNTVSAFQELKQTQEQDMQMYQAQINEVNNCILSIDRKITWMEDGLFRIYNEVLDHVENVFYSIIFIYKW